MRLESGQDVHKKLVDYAASRLQKEGVRALSFDAKTASGQQVDVQGYKGNTLIAVICQVIPQLGWVERKVDALRGDMIDKVVVCVPELGNSFEPKIPGLEVWVAEGVSALEKKAIDSSLVKELESLGRKLSAEQNRDFDLSSTIKLLLDEYKIKNQISVRTT
jgi:hypothetical protein